MKEINYFYEIIYNIMKKSIIMVLLVVLLLSISSINTWASFIFDPNLIYMNWPTTSRRITDTFGTPRDGGARKHAGIDIGPMKVGVAGDPVYAALAGTVKATDVKSYGYVVYLNSRGYNPWTKNYEYVQTRYVHVNTFEVDPGDSVQKGRLVATMGGTGGYPVHLHFETRIGTQLDMPTTDSATIPRDPLVSYTYNEPYRLPLNATIDSSTSEWDDHGEYGILKNSMLYTVDFILNQDPSNLSSYGITEADLEELLSDLKDNNTLYQKLYDHLK